MKMQIGLIFVTQFAQQIFSAHLGVNFTSLSLNERQYTPKQIQKTCFCAKPAWEIYRLISQMVVLHFPALPLSFFLPLELNFFHFVERLHTGFFYLIYLMDFLIFFKKLRYFQQRTSIIKLKHKFLPSSHAALKLACHDCCLRFVRRTNPFGFARAWLNGGRMK